MHVLTKEEIEKLEYDHPHLKPAFEAMEEPIKDWDD